MGHDWDDRRGGNAYDSRAGRNRDNERDWTDRAGDEMRSWFGDEDAERRRREDERRDQRGRGYSASSDYDYRPNGPGYGAARGYGVVGSDYGPGRDDGRNRDGYGRGGRDAFGYPRRDSETYDTRSRGGRDNDRDFFEKAGDEVASWFGDDDAARRRQMDQHRGKGPKNYTRSDDRIRDDVNDRLADDPHIDASDIEVTVSGGEVTLTGTVTERFAKRHAEDLAERISGVGHVQNNLRVGSGSAGTGLVSGATSETRRA